MWSWSIIWNEMRFILSCCLLAFFYQGRGRTPLTLVSLPLTEERQSTSHWPTASSVQRPSHFLPCQLGISTPASAADPSPPPQPSSPLLALPIPNCCLPTTNPVPLTLTHCHPPAFLAASHGLQAEPMLPQAKGSSAKSVPTFQYDGRFVGGISCGLSCQHRTITAQQSLAVTGEIKATVVTIIIDFWISPIVLDFKVDTFS